MQGLFRTLLVIAGVAAAAPAVAAESDFDGRWAVQMVTESGICDRSYNYAIAIEDGRVRYLPEPGDRPPSVSGKVGSNGAVNLGIQKGIAHVNASGRLQATNGGGTWRLALLGCSGRWTAQRRGSMQASR
jgi:hypothetical protein